jgi:hypothetical protein
MSGTTKLLLAGTVLSRQRRDGTPDTLACTGFANGESA